MFSIVKRYYEMGVYSVLDIAAFVRAKKLTAMEYTAITGEEYAG